MFKYQKCEKAQNSKSSFIIINDRKAANPHIKEAKSAILFFFFGKITEMTNQLLK